MRLTLLVCVLSTVLGVLPSPASATHGYDRDCPSFANQSAAQNHLLAHPGDPDGLDADRDGRACESLPCPCGATGTTPPPPPPPEPPPPPPPATPPPPPALTSGTQRLIYSPFAPD